MTLLAAHWDADSVWVTTALETTTDFIPCIYCSGHMWPVTVVLIVPFGQWLKNHCILLLGLLDQVKQILGRIIARGRPMVLLGATTVTVILILVLLLGTYIVIILALLSSAIICGINHG